MIDALPALRAAARELLAAEGQPRLAALVDRAGLELAGPGERWTMGSREVTAARLALLVDPAVYVELSREPARLAAVRDAFARAARTPETELAELTLVVRLPGLDRGLHHAYREAPRLSADPPAPEAVLGGAAALLEAAGDAAGAAALARATLEAAEIPTADPPALVRYVVRLDPADRTAADRDPRLAERLQRAVRDAGARALAAVAGVDLATALRPPRTPDDAEARLTRALAARGAVVVPVRRDEDGVELAVIAGGEIRRVEIVAPGHAPRDPAWRAETIAAMSVDRARLADAGELSLLAALLCSGGPLGEPDRR
jgi:hypothetical protein